MCFFIRGEEMTSRKMTSHDHPNQSKKFSYTTFYAKSFAFLILVEKQKINQVAENMFFTRGLIVTFLIIKSKINGLFGVLRFQSLGSLVLRKGQRAPVASYWPDRFLQTVNMLFDSIQKSMKKNFLVFFSLVFSFFY